MTFTGTGRTGEWILNHKRGVIGVTGGWLTGTQRMAKRLLVCEMFVKCDVLSQGKGGAGDDSGRICKLLHDSD